MIANQTSQLASKVESGEPVGLTLRYHSRTNINFLNSLITKILSRNNIVFLKDTIVTIVREIIVNAVKANSKRFYFQLQNLDINDTRDYYTGMMSFKDYIVGKKEEIEDELKKGDYRVDVYFKKTTAGLRIYIINNTPIHPDELARINMRIEKAKHYKDFSDVYCDVTDDTEGEGLGIVLTILFLRNSGIGEDSFTITSDGKVTQSSFIIPYILKPSEITGEIQQRILNEIEELPSFPENILELQRLCREPEVTIKELSGRIIQDPALTMSVLRLSNSAGFITMNRIESIDDAIKIIGLRNLNAILIASSARNIMEKKYSMFRQIWAHCNRVAFYSRMIAIRHGLAKKSDNIYLAGLLHDIGKIVLLSASGKLTDWIATVTRNHEIRTTTVIEEVSIGISHSTIGELITKKWNLPDFLVEAIRCHHSPMNTGEKYRDTCYTVYLANQLCGMEASKYHYFQLEEDVLTMFGIKGEDMLKELHEDVKKRFEEQEK